MDTQVTDPRALVHDLKVTLRYWRPAIWRRVLVPSDFSLNKLHRVLQIAMGWTNSHLHRFEIDKISYSDPFPDLMDDVGFVDERRVTLFAVAPKPRKRFLYEYDFGDGWLHDIRVEGVTTRQPGATYPICTDGARACPPEDVGGIGGFELFLQALKDPDHEEHASYQEWFGGPFDPKALDLAAINRQLRQLVPRRPRTKPAPKPYNAS